MPVYYYRALTKTGQEVKNRVEDSNKFSLIRKIKRNGLTPISVVQVRSGMRNGQIKRKNMDNFDTILKKVNSSATNLKITKKENTLKNKLNRIIDYWTKSQDQGCYGVYSEFLSVKKS